MISLVGSIRIIMSRYTQRDSTFRILVTGSRGQLGYDVCRELESRKIEYLGTTSASMDITDRAAVWKQIIEYCPDAVIHCAAYTAVDRAEDEPGRAFAVNEMGTRYIVEACKEIDAKLLYTSTDYVFPGVGIKPFETTDAIGPLNVYGKSKLAGEQAVLDLLEKYFIVRISWVFGEHGRNFVNTMLRLAESKTSIQVVCDQIGSPTYTADLAPLLCDMIQTEKYGLYHATNDGECSWAQFAEAIFRETGRNISIEKIPTDAYAAAKAARPLNSRLSKQSLSDAKFATLPHWEDALNRYLMMLEKKGCDNK